MKNNVKTRPIDKTAGNVSSWLAEKIIPMQEKQIKTWKGALIIAFFTGTAVALILTIAANIYASSKEAVTRVDVSETAAQPDVFSE